MLPLSSGGHQADAAGGLDFRGCLGNCCISRLASVDSQRCFTPECPNAQTVSFRAKTSRRRTELRSGRTE
jgi:hypothetical protein